MAPWILKQQEPGQKWKQTKWPGIIKEKKKKGKAMWSKQNRGHCIRTQAAFFRICVTLDLLNFTEVQFPS